MTAITNTTAFNNMLAHTEAAIDGGWNVLVRDVPTNVNRRMMDGVRNGVWFRMSVGDNPESISFRIRRAPANAYGTERSSSSDTYLVYDVDTINTILATRDKVPHGKLTPGSALLDRELPVALR